MSAVIEKISTLELENASLWIAEARFGADYVSDLLSALPDGLKVLEVGCGSGILLSMLAETFPLHDFKGIEPFGDGFSSLQELNAIIRSSGVGITQCGYENYSIPHKFDFIFCVNVFEHVDDWKHFLDWVSSALADNGQFLVLCPNYSFPYESHFKLPIIANKALTGLVFARHIEVFERDHDVHGLWKSLNFVKKRQVKRYLKKREELSLELTDDLSIIDDMVDRITTDEEFRKRQTKIGTVAMLLRRAGVFQLVKLFPNYLPYMKLRFRKQRSAARLDL